MPPLLADENFDVRVVAGVLVREPTADFITVCDVGLAATPDPEVLAWAATNGRVVVTYDRNSLVGYTYDRVHTGLPMSGVLLVNPALSVGQQIEEVLTAILCLDPDEFPNQVHYLPL